MPAFASPVEIGEHIEENAYGIYFGNMYGVEKSKKLPKYYREIAEKNNFYFMAASTYAKPCREDSVHMDAENHRKFADAIIHKIREIYGL